MIEGLGIMAFDGMRPAPAERLPEGAPMLEIDGMGDAVPCALCGPIGVSQAEPVDHLPAALRALVIGALDGDVQWDGVVLAGDERRLYWVHVSADEIVSFQGSLTPGLMADLGAVGMDAGALADTLSRPERLAAQLHRADLAGDAAALTGHLMGAELAAAKPYWLGMEVLNLCGAAWESALSQQGSMVKSKDPTAVMQRGLVRLAKAEGLLVDG
ncbi:MAG: 2-dehydro-3-deoxygalactonokinase [Roseovarius sp.]